MHRGVLQSIQKVNAEKVDTHLAFFRALHVASGVRFVRLCPGTGHVRGSKQMA